MTPGTYLHKRRIAAGLTLEDVARRIGAMPFAIRPLSPGEIARLARALEKAEADEDNVTIIQAEILRNAFRFDVNVYQALLVIHYAPQGSALVAPQLCCHCACSWCDPCVTHDGACSWAAPDLCTACVKIDAATAELSTRSTPQIAEARL